MGRKTHAEQRGSIPRGHALVLFSIIAATIVIIDQVTKHLVQTNIAPGDYIAFIPGLLDLTNVCNTGGGFSIFEGATTYFVVIAAAIIVATVAYLLYFKQHRLLPVVTFSLIVGGAAGNALDRILCSGRVTDFLATTFIDFPIFNVADIAVTCGCALFIIMVLIAPDEDKGGKQDGADE